MTHPSAEVPVDKVTDERLIELRDEYRDGCLIWNICTELLAARARIAESTPRKCAADMYADPPRDCDAPFCGCHPEWHKVIEMLQECGWQSPEQLRAQPRLTDEEREACGRGAGAMELLHDHARALPVLHTVLKKASEIVKGNSDMGAKRAEQMWLSLMDYLRPKDGGEIVNPHVLPAIREPRPDFDKMLAMLNGDIATLRALSQGEHRG
jgi:hypothetical protein